MPLPAKEATEVIVRKWLGFRRALIPYLVDESSKVVKSGYPIFRALIQLTKGFPNRSSVRQLDCDDVKVHAVFQRLLTIYENLTKGKLQQHSNPRQDCEQLMKQVYVATATKVE